MMMLALFTVVGSVELKVEMKVDSNDQMEMEVEVEVEVERRNEVERITSETN